MEIQDPDTRARVYRGTFSTLQLRSRAVQAEENSLIQSLLAELEESHKQAREHEKAAKAAASEIQQLQQDLVAVRMAVSWKDTRIDTLEDRLEERLAGCFEDRGE